MPKRDPVFLYQDLEGKTKQKNLKMLFSLTSIALTPQVTDILCFKSESNYSRSNYLDLVVPLFSWKPLMRFPKQ